MKKTVTFICLFIFISTMNAQTKSFYDFTVETLDGEKFEFTQLKGKKVMVVNTASKCGLTPQYEGLEGLYKEYGSEEFTIIGFPANNFMGQEPGTNKEIAEFCQKNYGVSFPMMAKISVKGDDMHPIYQWLTSKELNGVENSSVKWNFQKYLIDEKGQLAEVIAPTTIPKSEKIINWIQATNNK
ncbi:MAG: glutathione peroxidase [Flavobacteriales bacterium]|nr:MAG: glutathione peroxidase [Flavobacteriales bacterium]